VILAGIEFTLKVLSADRREVHFAPPAS
jgi:hypothetical protein